MRNVEFQDRDSGRRTQDPKAEALVPLPSLNHQVPRPGFGPWTLDFDFGLPLGPYLGLAPIVPRRAGAYRFPGKETEWLSNVVISQTSKQIG